MLRDAARAEGLTPAQHQLLLAVRGHAKGSAPSVSDLAEALQLGHHSVVGLVDRAQAAGHITSATDSEDARRRVVSLTTAGEGILERLSAGHRAELRGFREEMAELLHQLD